MYKLKLGNPTAHGQELPKLNIKLPFENMANDDLYIIDTSAILSGKLNITEENYIFPDSVLSEIKKGNFAAIFDYITVKSMKPSPKYIEIARAQASRTGDLNVLSETDIDVIALAIELNGTIITDDYAIQNVAKSAGIKYSGSGIDQIKKEIKWKYRCTGCHKVFNEYIEICPICGHEVKRFSKR
ncbi:MAG: PIN domain-containing protein [Ferroplasma sp.]